MAALILIAASLAGCNGARSISNSGYPAGYDPSLQAYPDTAYRGELSEFDLLIPATSEEISDQDISAALADRRPVAAELGKPLMVVQSGAIAPDAPMISALRERFPIVPFSGLPPTDQKSYAKRLRLAAASGGCTRILVYWGMLETQRHDEATSAVSWVPVVGWMIPDQSQEMRIRLKAAIIDVASGRWRMLTPEPVTDDGWSSRSNRVEADQDQVDDLKRLGYAALARQIGEQASLAAM
jgi:hypothetical protein